VRLLILKCSARKRGPVEPVPALERYDGPLWRVLRSFQRTQPLFVQDLAVYGLSAEYGLVPATQPIPDYDATMSPKRADQLRPQVLARFTELMQQDYRQLCLGVSQRYLRALQGWEDQVPAGVAVTLTDGPMGTKLGQLRAWLEGRTWQAPAVQPERLVAAAQPRGTATISGVSLQISREAVLEQARQALATDGQAARRYRDWYVLVDDQRVAPKWLVSLISGIPTSRFDAGRARQVLLALGVDVERNEPRG